MEDNFSGLPPIDVLLWIVGGVAVAFFLVIAYDGWRNFRKNHTGMRRRVGGSRGRDGSLGHWWRRTLYNWKMAKTLWRDGRRMRRERAKSSPHHHRH